MPSSSEKDFPSNLAAVTELIRRVVNRKYLYIYYAAYLWLQEKQTKLTVRWEPLHKI